MQSPTVISQLNYSTLPSRSLVVLLHINYGRKERRVLTEEGLHLLTSLYLMLSVNEPFVPWSQEWQLSDIHATRGKSMKYNHLGDYSVSRNMAVRAVQTHEGLIVTQMIDYSCSTFSVGHAVECR